MPTLTEFLCGGERRVPRRPLPSMSPLEAWGRPPASGLRATWLGHSTVLIEIDGLRVLTDPVWGPRASPSEGRDDPASRSPEPSATPSPSQGGDDDDNSGPGSGEDSGSDDSSGPGSGGSDDNSGPGSDNSGSGSDNSGSGSDHDDD